MLIVWWRGCEEEVGQFESLQEVSDVGREGEVHEGERVQPLEGAKEGQGCTSEIFKDSQEPEEECSDADTHRQLHQLQSCSSLILAVGVVLFDVNAGICILNGQGYR